MTDGRASLWTFRRKRRPAPVALVRLGPPTPGTDTTWEVSVDDHPFAVFQHRERLHAVDFANGFNLGTRWKP